MPRQIFYGDYHKQKHKRNKKIILIIIIAAVLFIGAAVYLFVTDTGGIGQAIRASVGEITELKMQLKEKDDRIAELEQEIEGYQQELALRPAPSATPIPPPNDQVAGSWIPTVPNVAATPKPSTKTKKKSSTKKTPASPTKAPAAPAKTPAAVTQPPVAAATQPPAAPTKAPAAPAAPEAGGEAAGTPAE